MDKSSNHTSCFGHYSGYMAPEYAMHGHFSVKSDVFSFGVLILEIVTGQQNKTGKNLEDLLSNVSMNIHHQLWYAIYKFLNAF